MASKDDCFKQAIETLEKTTGKKLGIEHQKEWVQDLDGSWSVREEQGNWRKLWNSIRKTLAIQSKLRDPRPEGSSNPIQNRRPDMTITTKEGTNVVVDNKFTGKDGKPDEWRNKEGAGNGKTQLHDYNEINEQHNPGNPKAKNLELNKDVCKCNENPQPFEVAVPNPAINPHVLPYLLPLPGPGGVPGVPPVPVPEIFPGGIPIFP